MVFARRASELKKTGSIAGWLHRVVTLESIALRRKRSTRNTYESEAMKERLNQSEGLPSEALPELDQLIQDLRPKDQQAVILHYLEGRSFPSIASRLGGTPDGWRKRCSRALEKLATKLRSKGISSATGLAIATTFSSQRAEAAMSPKLVATMTRDALLHQSTGGSLSVAGPLAFIIMKTKIGLVVGILSGTMLSFAMDRHRVDQRRPPEIQRDSIQTQEESRRLRPVRAFDLEALIAALIAYDEAVAPSNRTESRLRMLMFSIPTAEQVELVADSTKALGNPSRFTGIIAALYARWAELDPAAAWDAASRLDNPRAARKGAMLTWLSMDREAAFEKLMSSRGAGDLEIMVEFLRHRSSSSPREAAFFVDEIARVWPEADRRLFPLVAKAWVMTDPEAAGDWVASHPDRERPNNLLHALAKRIIRERHGILGIGLADMIDDPAKRSAARLDVIRWFGIASGGYALREDTVRPNRDLRSGFPEDWTREELSAFSLGFMANFVKDYPLLIGAARNDDERQSIYLGVIRGAGFSNPSLVADAVEGLDPVFVEGNADHRESLRVFMLRWHETDPESAKAWFDRQPSGPKADIMKDAMSDAPQEP